MLVTAASRDVTKRGILRALDIDPTDLEPEQIQLPPRHEAIFCRCPRAFILWDRDRCVLGR